MRSKRALGLTMSQWSSLPRDEQIVELAWDQYQQEQLNELMAALREQKMNTPEAVTLIALARNGLL